MTSSYVVRWDEPHIRVNLIIRLCLYKEDDLGDKMEVWSLDIDETSLVITNLKLHIQ